jgi:hypothetical protein
VCPNFVFETAGFSRSSLRLPHPDRGLNGLRK